MHGGSILKIDWMKLCSCIFFFILLMIAALGFGIHKGNNLALLIGHLCILMRSMYSRISHLGLPKSWALFALFDFLKCLYSIKYRFNFMLTMPPRKVLGHSSNLTATLIFINACFSSCGIWAKSCCSNHISSQTLLPLLPLAEFLFASWISTWLGNDKRYNIWHQMLYSYLSAFWISCVMIIYFSNNYVRLMFCQVFCSNC